MFAQGMLLYSNTDLISVLVLEVKDLLPPLSIILIFLFHRIKNVVLLMSHGGWIVFSLIQISARLQLFYMCLLFFLKLFF